MRYSPRNSRRIQSTRNPFLTYSTGKLASFRHNDPQQNEQNAEADTYVPNWASVLGSYRTNVSPVGYLQPSGGSFQTSAIEPGVLGTLHSSFTRGLDNLSLRKWRFWCKRVSLYLSVCLYVDFIYFVLSFNIYFVLFQFNVLSFHGDHDHKKPTVTT